MTVLQKWCLPGQKYRCSKLAESDAQRLKNLEHVLQKRVIGQDEAVERSCKGREERKSRTERSEAPDRFLPVPGTDRCWKDRIIKSTGRSIVWE